MSRINGEKARAATAIRRRNAQRLRMRELRRRFLESRSAGPAAAAPPPREQPPRERTRPEPAAAPAVDAATGKPSRGSKKSKP